MPGTDRQLDLVLVGATGFVGRLTARYLAEHAPAQLRVALAGRSRGRVESVRASLGAAAAGWDVVSVDVMDETAVAALAAKTGVVVTTVGPYAKYGLPLIRACAAAGTHYADLTGEVLFVREAVDTCHETAVASGAKLVTSCGFDSIPSDLGVLVLAEQVAADGEGTLGETTLRVRSMRGGFSGGTIDSGRHQAAVAASSAQARRVIADSYSLSPDRAAEPPSRTRRPQRGGLHAALDKASAMTSMGRNDRGRWSAPFVMASHNTRIVRRSNALSGYRYGRGFRYAEVTDTGSGVLGAARAAGLTAALSGLLLGMSYAPTRSLLGRVLPKPGEGPSEQAQAAGRFVIDIETTTTTGARYVARVSADKDPGYSGTAVMLGESGLCLAADDLPEGGGVLTPATAMGDALTERLRAHGFVFDVRRA